MAIATKSNSSVRTRKSNNECGGDFPSGTCLISIAQMTLTLTNVILITINMATKVRYLKRNRNFLRYDLLIGIFHPIRLVFETS